MLTKRSKNFDFARHDDLIKKALTAVIRCDTEEFTYNSQLLIKEFYTFNKKQSKQKDNEFRRIFFAELQKHCDTEIDGNKNPAILICQYIQILQNKKQMIKEQEENEKEDSENSDIDMSSSGRLMTSSMVSTQIILINGFLKDLLDKAPELVNITCEYGLPLLFVAVRTGHYSTTCLVLSKTLDGQYYKQQIKVEEQIYDIFDYAYKNDESGKFNIWLASMYIAAEKNDAELAWYYKKRYAETAKNTNILLTYLRETAIIEFVMQRYLNEIVVVENGFIPEKPPVDSTPFLLLFDGAPESIKSGVISKISASCAFAENLIFNPLLNHPLKLKFLDRLLRSTEDDENMQTIWNCLATKPSHELDTLRKNLPLLNDPFYCYFYLPIPKNNNSYNTPIMTAIQNDYPLKAMYFLDLFPEHVINYLGKKEPAAYEMAKEKNFLGIVQYYEQTVFPALDRLLIAIDKNDPDQIAIQLRLCSDRICNIDSKVWERALAYDEYWDNQQSNPQTTNSIEKKYQKITGPSHFWINAFPLFCLKDTFESEKSRENFSKDYFFKHFAESKAAKELMPLLISDMYQKLYATSSPSLNSFLRDIILYLNNKMDMLGYEYSAVDTAQLINLAIIHQKPGLLKLISEHKAFHVNYNTYTIIPFMLMCFSDKCVKESRTYLPRLKVLFDSIKPVSFIAALEVCPTNGINIADYPDLIDILLSKDIVGDCNTMLQLLCQTKDSSMKLECIKLILKNEDLKKPDSEYFIRLVHALRIFVKNTDGKITTVFETIKKDKSLSKILDVIPIITLKQIENKIDEHNQREANEKAAKEREVKEREVKEREAKEREAKAKALQSKTENKQDSKADSTQTQIQPTADTKTQTKATAIDQNVKSKSNRSKKNKNQTKPQEESQPQVDNSKIETNTSNSKKSKKKGKNQDNAKGNQTKDETTHQNVQKTNPSKAKSKNNHSELDKVSVDNINTVDTQKVDTPMKEEVFTGEEVIGTFGGQIIPSAKPKQAEKQETTVTEAKKPQLEPANNNTLAAAVSRLENIEKFNEDKKGSIHDIPFKKLNIANIVIHRKLNLLKQFYDAAPSSKLKENQPQYKNPLIVGSIIPFLILQPELDQDTIAKIATTIKDIDIVVDVPIDELLTVIKDYNSQFLNIKLDVNSDLDINLSDDDLFMRKQDSQNTLFQQLDELYTHTTKAPYYAKERALSKHLRNIKNTLTTHPLMDISNQMDTSNISEHLKAFEAILKENISFLNMKISEFKTLEATKTKEMDNQTDMGAKKYIQYQLMDLSKDIRTVETTIKCFSILLERVAAMELFAKYLQSIKAIEKAKTNPDYIHTTFKGNCLTLTFNDTKDIKHLPIDIVSIAKFDQSVLDDRDSTISKLFMNPYDEIVIGNLESFQDLQARQLKALSANTLQEDFTRKIRFARILYKFKNVINPDQITLSALEDSRTDFTQYVDHIRKLEATDLIMSKSNFGSDRKNKKQSRNLHYTLQNQIQKTIEVCGVFETIKIFDELKLLKQIVITNDQDNLIKHQQLIGSIKWNSPYADPKEIEYFQRHLQPLLDFLLANKDAKEVLSANPEYRDKFCVIVKEVDSLPFINCKRMGQLLICSALIMGIDIIELIAKNDAYLEQKNKMGLIRLAEAAAYCPTFVPRNQTAMSSTTTTTTITTTITTTTTVTTNTANNTNTNQAQPAAVVNINTTENTAANASQRMYQPNETKVQGQMPPYKVLKYDGYSINNNKKV